MAKYRIYLSEGRQIDLDADTFKDLKSSSTGKLIRIDFFSNEGKTVASFSAEALQGFTEISHLVTQKNTVPQREE